MRFFLFVFFLASACLMAGQLYKKHPNPDSVDQEFDEVYRGMANIVIASRRPFADDKAKAGTFWINASSTTLYVRFPDENAWRLITTVAP